MRQACRPRAQLLKYNIGSASGLTTDATIQRRAHTPCRGSDKAMKYLNNRFKQKHVKVQNLTLIVSPCLARLCCVPDIILMHTS